MKCKHHDLEFEIDDEWLRESHMDNFIPDSSAYRVDEALARGQDIFHVAIVDIAPMNERAKKKGVFCDNDEGTARDRVVRILRWFREGAKVAPVRVVKLDQNNKYKFKLVAGSHRFHCAVAVGFSKVPAIIGIDINDPNL
jgi:hypothetical protein